MTLSLIHILSVIFIWLPATVSALRATLITYLCDEVEYSLVMRAFFITLNDRSTLRAHPFVNPESKADVKQLRW